MEEVRRFTSQCHICCEVKPNYHRREAGTLIKSTSAFERLSIDFKGPVPLSKNQNAYILTVADEYSRFPWAFPVRDLSTATVIRCLRQLFSIFGYLRSYTLTGGVRSCRWSSKIGLHRTVFVLAEPRHITLQGTRN